MSREDVVAVASRLFAVFLVVSALRTIGSALQAQQEISSITGLVYYTLPVVVPYLLAAALLWYFPLTVARKLLPAMRDSGSPITPGANNIAAIAFSVLGMWMLASAISDGVYWVVLLSGFFSQGTSPAYLSAREKARILGTVAQVAIGFYLLFGAKGLAALLHKLRYGSAE